MAQKGLRKQQILIQSDKLDTMNSKQILFFSTQDEIISLKPLLNPNKNKLEIYSIKL